MDAYDVVILGCGSAGGYAASLLADGGKRVAVVEERRVGGECPYVACIPSKAMLTAAELRHSIARSAVMAGAISRPLALDEDREAYAAAVARRDVVSKHRDDAGAVRHLEGKGIRVIKTRGRIEGFLVGDHYDLAGEYAGLAAQWLGDGRLQSRETFADGIDSAVDAFLGVLRGDNTGKMIVKL